MAARQIENEGMMTAVRKPDFQMIAARLGTCHQRPHVRTVGKAIAHHRPADFRGANLLADPQMALDRRAVERMGQQLRRLPQVADIVAAEGEGSGFDVSLELVGHADSFH